MTQMGEFGEQPDLVEWSLLVLGGLTILAVAVVSISYQLRRLRGVVQTHRQQTRPELSLFQNNTNSTTNAPLSVAQMQAELRQSQERMHHELEQEISVMQELRHGVSTQIADLQVMLNTLQQAHQNKQQKEQHEKNQ
uniref:Uncharacterized protein n=1 Tax=Attheya septentrionalis TaxID=420275 RepID=A0A7S2UFW8_9STRA|mmetsp:Transcript_23181/g.41874  ORF Transcript_23181/g.41874 Transcript_23181/m.41874 type:complete len:137 (+) Transcript_23181:160-570(+)